MFANFIFLIAVLERCNLHTMDTKVKNYLNKIISRKASVVPTFITYGS